MQLRKTCEQLTYKVAYDGRPYIISFIRSLHIWVFIWSLSYFENLVSVNTQMKGTKLYFPVTVDCNDSVYAQAKLFPYVNETLNVTIHN